MDRNPIKKILRQRLKKILPNSLVVVLSSAENYAKRLVICAEIAKTIRGVESQDKEVLRRALFNSPLSILKELRKCWQFELPVDATVMVDDLGLFRIRGNCDDLHHVVPSVNDAIRAVIAEYAAPGDVVIDAGANIGAVTVSMANIVGPQGKVIAVEMVPETAKQLRINAALNGLVQVEVVELALSNSADQAIPAQIAVGLFGQASITADSNAGNSVSHFEVKTTTLDVITAEFAWIAVMKMDLEGAELFALLGAEHLLDKIGMIVFESWSLDCGKVGSFLRERGFTISCIDSRNFKAVRDRYRHGRELMCL